MNSNAPNDDARSSGDASPDANANWDPYSDNTDLGERSEPPLWRRLHPNYRPHEHVHTADDPWDDARRIDGIIAQTHADLDGHPVEQIVEALTERFRDSNLHLHVTQDTVRMVAEDIASGTATHWSGRTLAGAHERQRKTDASKAGASKADAPKTDAPKADAPKADAPEADAPNADAPATDAPKTDASEAEAPESTEEQT